MALYAIGDIQGCVSPLEELLEKLRFDPVADTMLVTGDVVNRGPDSLQALRLVKDLGDSAITVLGNHDLHFLSVAHGHRNPRSGDTLKPILRAPDFEELVDWLRHRPLAYLDKSNRLIMTHAGVYPGWRAKQAFRYAGEVEKVLRSKKAGKFLSTMYGCKPVHWDEELSGWERLRFITNALTRMRYCRHDGSLDFKLKGPPTARYKKVVPWFEHPAMKCSKWRVVFGHWSALGYMQHRNIISLDSGCVWGGALTAVRLDSDYHAPSWQVKC